MTILSNQSIKLLLATFILLVVGLTSLILFSFPFFYIGGDGIQEISYDVEPDYFANILGVISFGHVFDFLHPGVSITYPVGYIASFLNLNPEQIVILARAYSLTVFLISISFSSILLKLKINQFFILLGLIFIFPGVWLLFDRISPDLVLGALFILKIGLVFRYLDNPTYLKLVFIALISSLMISTKYTGLIFIFPFLLLFFFYRQGNDKWDSMKPKYLIIYLFLFIFFSTFFLRDLLPFLPLVITQLDFFKIIFDMNYVLLGSIFLALFIALLLVRKYLISKAESFEPKKTIKLVYLSILFIGVLILISIFLQSSELKETALKSRHLIGFIMPIILIVSKINPNKFSYMVGVLFLATSFSTKMLSNHQHYLYGEKFSLNFYDDIFEISKSNNISFFPTDNFISKDLFFAWADYRYGSPTPFKDESYKLKMHEQLKINHFQFFDLRGIQRGQSDSFYLEFLSKSPYLSKAHQRILQKLLNSIESKNICYQGINNQINVSDFSIVFPKSYKSFVLNNNLESPDIALEKIKNLQNKIKIECGFRTKLDKFQSQGNFLYELYIQQ